MRRRSATAAILQAISLSAGLSAPACAQQILLQGETARLAVEPYAAATKLGSRATLGASLGALDASLSAGLERGGGRLNLGEAPWGFVQVPAAWTSESVGVDARWALADNAQLRLDAENRARRSHNFAGPMGSAADDQLATDLSRMLRLQAAIQAERLDMLVGAETSTAVLDTRALDDGETSPSRHWLTSRRLFGQLHWRPSSSIAVQAGQAAQTLSVGWRSGAAITSASTYLTPSLAVAVTPWTRTQWRFELEQALAPIDPAQFAAYAQIATPGTGSAPRPDHGWRYNLGFERQLAGGVSLGAQISAWRLANVTELAPVGGGEAPASIGAGDRQLLQVKLAAPLERLGLDAARIAGELTWRRSQLTDPFTGQRRAFSGEAPYRAQLTLTGALDGPALQWSLTAKADGPQSLYQMSQVTSLGATAGLGGALTYGAGPLAIRLELDNVVGGARQVTTYSYAASRAAGGPVDVSRRDDEARAVRISLRRPL